MVKLHCHICGIYCAKKPDEIPFMIAPGADVRIIATCADCTRKGVQGTRKGYTDPTVDQLKNLFGIFGIFD